MPSEYAFLEKDHIRMEPQWLKRWTEEGCQAHKLKQDWIPICVGGSGGNYHVDYLCERYRTRAGGLSYECIST